MHIVYIVRCSDGSLYTGYTRDLDARIVAHNRGRGARYTSGRRPVVLLYSASFRSLGEALRREHALKRLSRTAKETLIARSKTPGRTGSRTPTDRARRGAGA